MDFTAQQARKLSADGEPKPGAAIFAAGRGVGLLESLEDDLLFLQRNANAGVGDLECDNTRGLIEQRMAGAPAAYCRRYCQPHAALAGEFKRVRQQVLEHLLQALRVGGERAAEIRIDDDVKSKLTVLGLMPERPRHHVQQVGEENLLSIN